MLGEIIVLGKWLLRTGYYLGERVIDLGKKTIVGSKLPFLDKYLVYRVSRNSQFSVNSFRASK